MHIQAALYELAQKVLQDTAVSEKGRVQTCAHRTSSLHVCPQPISAKIHMELATAIGEGVWDTGRGRLPFPCVPFVVLYHMHSSLILII